MAVLGRLEADPHRNRLLKALWLAYFGTTLNGSRGRCAFCRTADLTSEDGAVEASEDVADEVSYATCKLVPEPAPPLPPVNCRITTEE